MTGIPSQLAALNVRADKILADIDHMLTALGDVLHGLDKLSRCQEIVLKLTRHIHSDVAERRKRRRRITHRNRKASKLNT